MTRDIRLFEACGDALYGSQWRAQLGTALEVNERTIRRWVAGSNEIPDGAWVDMKKLLKARAAMLRALAKDV